MVAACLLQSDSAIMDPYMPLPPQWSVKLRFTSTPIFGIGIETVLIWGARDDKAHQEKLSHRIFGDY